jgi:hypothetical protein
MNLFPVEAITRVNESVTVEMLVQRTKRCTGSRQVFLDSEADHRDPKTWVWSSPRVDGLGLPRRELTTLPPGGTHQILSMLVGPTRISSRNAVSNAAALRFRAILFFAGFRFSKLSAFLRSTPKFSAA